MIYNVLLLWLPLATVVSAGCQNEGTQDANGQQNIQDTPYGEAISTILTRDGELAAIRDHACEDTTLSATIRQYVAGIDALDFSGCPAEFTGAFRRHRDAWENSIAFFGQFDSLRGEMHLLFETIERGGESQKAAYEKELKAIMDTWSEVETAARHYRALTAEE